MHSYARNYQRENPRSYKKPQLTAEELDAFTRNASALDITWLSRF